MAVFRIKKVIQTIRKPDAELPDRVNQEDEQENEEAFGGKPAGGSFGFEETDVECFKEKLEVGDHMRLFQWLLRVNIYYGIKQAWNHYQAIVIN